MRRMVPVLLIVRAAIAAPQQSPPAQVDKQELYHLLDDIRSNIRNADWNEAWRLSVRLDSTLARFTQNRLSPNLELRHLELLAGKDAISRGQYLARMAHAAYAADDLVQAERLAREALEASTHGVFSWTGDAIHQGNIVLGRLALRHNDVEAAKRYLLAAGKTPGSSSLNAFGPNMALARDLLDRGERETVLAYLEECGAFWSGNRGKLAEWIVLVRGGLKPDFGANLNY